MSEHSNLYKLLHEDCARHPMPEAKNREIRKNLENFCKNIKPETFLRPLTNTKRKQEAFNQEKMRPPPQKESAL